MSTNAKVGKARVVPPTIPSRQAAVKVTSHIASGGQANFFTRAPVPAPESTNPEAVDTRLHTLLYELQEEVDIYRKETARSKAVSTHETDFRKASTSAIVHAEREKEELRSALQSARHDVKAKDKELEARLRRVDTAARSEVTRKERTALEEVQASLKEVKTKAAEREAKNKADIDQLRAALHEERAKSARLEATVHRLQTPTAEVRQAPRAVAVPQPHVPKVVINNQIHHPVTSVGVPGDFGMLPKVVRFKNGDTKETDHSGVVRYWFAEKRTMVTTQTDGTKVVEFTDIGQREVHHLDGSRDVFTKDGDKVHFPHDSCT